MFAKTSALYVSVGLGEERLVWQQRTVICYNFFYFTTVFYLSSKFLPILGIVRPKAKGSFSKRSLNQER